MIKRFTLTDTLRILLSFTGGIFLTISSSQAKPQWIPVFNGEWATGQWYFEGKESALGGNVSLTYVPALKLSETIALLPTLESSYRGTASAQELAGGNTLFQDSWEMGGNLKLVHTLSPQWKISEHTSFKNKWARETEDESWGDGLYDYRTISFGLGLERRWGKNPSLGFNYSYSLMTFPNYQSIETTSGEELSREYAGENPLDAQIHVGSLHFKTPLPGNFIMGIHTLHSLRLYKDQTVVQLTGLLSPTKRKDTLWGAQVSIEKSLSYWREKNMLINPSLGYYIMNSNQNHYDASRTTYIGNFYDYKEQKGGLNLSFELKQTSFGPLTLDTGFALQKRSYPDRLIQDQDGNYLSEKLYTKESMASVGLSMPVSRNIRLLLSSNFMTHRSNNRCEELYKYNYESANYQFGFVYDF